MLDAPALGKPRIIATHPPFSFFRLAEDYNNSLPLKRIFSVMRKHKVASIVEEDIHPDHEFADEIAALEKRLSKKVVSNKIVRFTFFDIDIKKHGIDKASDRNCLGSVIYRTSLIEDGKTVHNVYEAVIRHQRLLNNYIHCFSNYHISCLGKTFSIKASYFCQQNDKTNVCAHASLKMISHNLQRLKVKPFVYEEINKTLGIDHVAKRLGNGKGLSVAEVTAILKSTGLEIKGHYYEEGKNPPYTFEQLIYSSVESGCPALLAFKTANGGGHIVPVIGHTFNDDNWLPNAEQDYFHLEDVKYLRSTAWVNNFIIHDDNYGVYYCLPVKFFRNEDLIAVYQIFPKGVKEAPINIELQAAFCLEDSVSRLDPSKNHSENYWLKKLSGFIKSGKFIIRTFLIKKAEYIKSLNEKDVDGAVLEMPYIEHLKNNLPSIFWISEISLPELFPTNKRKIADIIIDSSRNMNENNFYETLLFMRVPGQVAIPISDEIKAYPTHSVSHIPVIARRSI